MKKIHVKESKHYSFKIMLVDQVQGVLETLYSQIEFEHREAQHNISSHAKQLNLQVWRLN